MRCARGRHQGPSYAAQSGSIEPGCGNGIDGSAVRLATAGQSRPRLGDQVLEPIYLALSADMLEDDQPASGREHTPDLAQGSAHIVDRAQHQPDVYRVETVVRERNRLANPVDDVDCDAAAVSDTRRRPPKRGHRLHGGDRSHRGRQELQVGPRAETEHQQPAGRMSDRRPAIPVIERSVEKWHAEAIYAGEQGITAHHLRHPRQRLMSGTWSGSTPPGTG